MHQRKSFKGPRSMTLFKLHLLNEQTKYCWRHGKRMLRRVLYVGVRDAYRKINICLSSLTNPTAKYMQAHIGKTPSSCSVCVLVFVCQPNTIAKTSRHLYLKHGARSVRHFWNSYTYTRMHSIRKYNANAVHEGETDYTPTPSARARMSGISAEMRETTQWQIGYRYRCRVCQPVWAKLT